MLSTLLLTLAPAAPPPVTGRDLVAVQAGTIHVVEDGRVIEGGGTILIRDGKIVGVGRDVDIPDDARVVDYGPSAVIIPGLVAADSGFGGRSPSPRTASPGLAAIDQVDTHGNYASTLAAGVTTAYVPPARGRLIAGHGAVVKLGGTPGKTRVLDESAAIHGSISADARSTPGYWEPPVPASVDEGLGLAQPQLPRTTMGAMIALRELLALAADPTGSEEYGPYTGSELAELIEAGEFWRMRGESENEIRALLEFFGENNLPLVLTGAGRGGALAGRIAKQEVPVIVYASVRHNAPVLDRGKSEDANWPDLALASKLAAAGVRVAVVPQRDYPLGDLRFYAKLAQRGGMSSETALSSITLDAARVLGVDKRVGSLAAGKDADLVVLSGAPLASTSGVLATWIDGEIAWKAHENNAVVLEVEHLYVGGDEMLSPGEILLADGKIVEVGRRVSHPNGCTVVRGVAAMPGMIDTMGHLGLEGSSKVPATRHQFSRMVEPGDFADRRVAQAGVTTVLMTPRGIGGSGTPAMAYKPAGTDLESMVIADPAVMHLQWTSSDRLKSGAQVRSVLQKAVEYKGKWDEYHVAIAKWVPPPPEPPKEAEADEDEADEDAEEEAENGDEEKSKKKKKKKKNDEDPPIPVTGVWLTESASVGEGSDCARMRLQLLDEEGTLEGYLRCDAISETLVQLDGTRAEHAVELTGLGSKGDVTISAKTEKGKLLGTVKIEGVELTFEAEQTSKEYVVAKRGERRKGDAPERVKSPKGMPKSPGLSPDLEPFRAALEGRKAIVVRVQRDDEILDCVAAFEAVGIAPILYGANDAWKVADEIVGRVRGVLLDHRVIYSDSRMGTEQRNRYAELANAGIPVAFHSSAEEGAAELPLIAAYAVSQGMSPAGAVNALTQGAARMMAIDDRVGSLKAGLDADVLLLDGDPMDLGTSVLRVWVGGREVRLH
jgi:imidazolonepropionase-like amidohydrolase